MPDASGEMADLIAAMDFSYGLADIRQALERLGPSVYAAYLDASVRNLRLVERAVSRSLKSEAVEFEQNWYAWAEGLGDWGRRAENQGFSAYSWDTEGLVLGLEHRPVSWLRLGVDFAFTETSLRWSESDSSGSQQGKYAGAYAGMQYGGFSSSALVLGGFLENRGKRVIALADRSAQAGARFDAVSLLARLDMAYEQRINAFAFAPRAAFSRVQAWQSGFDESDAGYLGLHVDAADQGLCSLELGGNVSTALELENVRLRTTLDLAWRHDIPDAGEDGVHLSARFLEYPGASMRLNAPAPQLDALLTGVGLKAEFGDHLNASLDYSLTCGSQEIEHGVGLSFGLRF